MIMKIYNSNQNYCHHVRIIVAFFIDDHDHMSPSLLPPPHPPQPTDLAYNSVSSLSEQFPAALQGEAALRMPQLWKTHIKKNRRASTVGYKISKWIL